MRQVATALGLLLCVTSNACLAQEYNATAGTYEVPLNPPSPTSFAQCDVLQQQWSRLQQSLDTAHQNCLTAHRQEPENPGASTGARGPVCSREACQSLHAAWLRVMQEAPSHVQSCRTQVSAFDASRHAEMADQEEAGREAQAALDAAAAQQQSDQARQAAAAQIGAALEQHIDQLRAMKHAEEQDPTASAALPSTPELNGDSPFAGATARAAGTAAILDPASNLVRAG